MSIPDVREYECLLCEDAKTEGIGENCTACAAWIEERKAQMNKLKEIYK